jgi:hypothetical protein
MQIRPAQIGHLSLTMHKELVILVDVLEEASIQHLQVLRVAALCTSRRPCMKVRCKTQGTDHGTTLLTCAL